MGENKLCMITGCIDLGTKHVRIDIGPTAGDAVVPESERKHDVLVCDKHHSLMSNPEEVGFMSIGESVVKRNVFEDG